VELGILSESADILWRGGAPGGYFVLSNGPYFFVRYDLVFSDLLQTPTGVQLCQVKNW